MIMDIPLPEIWDKMAEIMQITIQYGNKIQDYQFSI